MNQLARPTHQGLQLRLLGGFECSWNGSPIAGISYDKMRALLAYLAMEQAQASRRELLADMLWSSSDRVTARGNLRRTLSDLRRVLEVPAGTSLFSASNSIIQFMPGADVDALAFSGRSPLPPHEFDSTPDNERFIQLYRGEFMAGFYLPDCPDFEDWLLVQRDALHRRALALLEQAANFNESIGERGKALRFALRHADLAPWDEAAHRRVMRLYALSDQSGAALRQFELCAILLKKDLGLMPGPQTSELAERIRSAEFTRGSPDVPAVALPVATTATPAPAERRQVTVLFCELTAPGVDDADDAMDLLSAPRARGVEILRRHSGHLVPMPGGGLLAYLGFPQSHEDSAVRAVRAALAVTRDGARGIGIRAGVHTGPITTGSDPALPDVVGQTSGIAIQLRRCVGPGETAISQATHRIVAGYFDCLSLGVQSLPDLSPSVAAFRVEGESGARTRLDAATTLTPLVGRQDELARLTALWNQAAKKGLGHAVLVQGEAAIGKSRLAHAFKQRLAGEPHVVRELRCDPAYGQSPFHPLLALLEAEAGFVPGDAPELKSAKLAQYVTAHYPAVAPGALPTLISLYALPPLPQDAELSASGLSPQRQKAHLIALLCAMLTAAPAQLPILLVVEDLHWADPSTLELLSTLFEAQGTKGLLAVFTARPGFKPPQVACVLSLEPLARNEMERLVALVNEELPAETVRRIVERADGVPLFAEELAKTATGGDWAGVPATLQDALAARIDQLGKAKHCAQMAATIGRQFGVELMSALGNWDPPALARSLDQMMDIGLILKVDDTTFRFKHALMQEAAYQLQARPDRQSAHRQIAEVLQGRFADSVMARPEVVAQHLSSGGDLRQSIAYWARAGQRTISGSANLEAIAHFNRGLQALTTLPAAQEKDRTELAILVNLCPALHATQGYGSEEVTRVTARISALRERVADSPELFLAEWARLRNALANLGPRDVPAAAVRLLELAGNDSIRKQAAHYVAAIGTFWLGEFEASRRHAAAAIALYRPEQHLPMLELFGEDLSVSFAGHLSWTLSFLGHADQARATSDRMIEQARTMEHPKTLAMALLFASMLQRWLNNHTQTVKFAAEATALARQYGMPHWAATAEVLHGRAQVMLAVRQDLGELQSLAQRLGAGAPAYVAQRLCDLAEAHMHLKLYGEALDLLAQARLHEERNGTRQFAAERCRLEGVCQLACSPSDAGAAEASFDQALAISRQQGARALELRAAMCLARLWRQQGKKEPALALLADVHGGFTEGFDTPDLVEAKGLLRAFA